MMAFRARESLTNSETQRLATFLSECLLVGTLKGFYYFEVYLRGREELLLQVYNDIKPHSGSKRPNSQPTSFNLARSRPTNILSNRTQRSLKTTPKKGRPLPLNPTDKELEKDESRASFLIAGYPRYKCPYVWLRSNPKNLINNQEDQKFDANDPLKLSTISSWRTDDVRLWDIMAEIITLTLSAPTTINPYQINAAYFEKLPLEECVIATGAMVDFLQRVYMKDTPYTEAVYADIRYLQRLHFALFDELHCFLTDRLTESATSAEEQQQSPVQKQHFQFGQGLKQLQAPLTAKPPIKAQEQKRNEQNEQNVPNKPNKPNGPNGQNGQNLKNGNQHLNHQNNQVAVVAKAVDQSPPPKPLVKYQAPPPPPPPPPQQQQQQQPYQHGPVPHHRLQKQVGLVPDVIYGAPLQKGIVGS